QIGGDGETSEDKEAEAEAEQERLEALREAEERRKEKHRRMEEEREKMRQQIRDKYGIKKKEEEKPAEVDDFAAGSLNRRKKTPEEIAAENEAAEQDDLTRLRNTIETQVNELKSSIEGKCVLHILYFSSHVADFRERPKTELVSSSALFSLPRGLWGPWGLTHSSPSAETVLIHNTPGAYLTGAVTKEGIAQHARGAGMPALPPEPPTIGPNRGRCCCCRCCRGFARNKSAGAQEAAERATKCPLCRAPVLLWGPAASAAKGHRMSFRRIERRQGSGAARGSTLECAPRRPPPRNGPDWRREIAGCQSVAQLGVAAKTKTAGKAFRVELARPGALPVGVLASASGREEDGSSRSGRCPCVPAASSGGRAGGMVSAQTTNSAFLVALCRSGGSPLGLGGSCEPPAYVVVVVMCMSWTPLPRRPRVSGPGPPRHLAHGSCVRETAASPGEDA
ncbi:hypothetical protein HPB47_000459, partial [Ixodes persulcatus]